LPICPATARVEVRTSINKTAVEVTFFIGATGQVDFVRVSSGMC